MVADKEALLDPAVGRHGHAVFLGLVERMAPTLAEWLHGPAPLKPFTVSPLQGKFTPIRRPNGVKMRVTAGETYWMRFTTLSQAVFQPFLAAFLDRPGTSVGQPPFYLRLQDAYFMVTEVITTPSSETIWSGYTEWERLLQEARPEWEITVQFYSPTTFRQNGINVVDPRPELVFGSWWAKWRAFAPAEYQTAYLRDGEAPSKDASSGAGSEIFGRIGISALAIRTRMLDFGTFKQVGFVGRVTYDLSRLSDTERWWLNVLADFAFYAGTGAKTTMGMGQTRRLRRCGEFPADHNDQRESPGPEDGASSGE